MATTRLQVSLSAQGLKNKSGLLQTSDPFAIVSVRGDDPDNAPLIAGHTNVAYDNLSPSWSTVVILEGYKLGSPMFIEVGIFDFSAKQVGEKESKLAKQEASATNVLISSSIKANLAKGTKFPHKIMGSALFEVGETLGTRGNVSSKSLQKSAGQVSIHIESSHASGDMGQLRLQLGALDLVNPEILSAMGFGSSQLSAMGSAVGSAVGSAMGIGNRCSPFFIMSRRVEQPTSDIVWTNVYKSNVVKAELNPVWDEAVLDLETLCNCDLDRKIKIAVFGYRKSGKHNLLGEFKTTVKNLIESRTVTASSDDRFHLNADEEQTMAGISVVNKLSQAVAGSILVLEAELLYPQKQKRKSETTSQTSKSKTSNKAETTIPKTIAFNQRPDFVDYTSGGCKINLSIAIDCTECNGNPIERGSLHYIHRSQSAIAVNDYEKAIKSVCNILAPYDSDQMFPVRGFGAKFNGDYDVRHCFPLGGEDEVHGVDGVLKAYRKMFDSEPFEMGSSTVFRDVIREAAQSATKQLESAQAHGKLSYNILLILTAGGNGESVQEDKAALVEAADAPLSVVIVGIGDADFSAMEYLDGDDFDGTDICQFVRFNDYRNAARKFALTEAVLDELPDQLVDHFYGKEIMPGQPERADPKDFRLQKADSIDRNDIFFSPRRGSSRVAI